MIAPGATLGMLGGGQLGRFFVLAAKEFGYRVMVLDPDPHSPAGQLADVHLCAAYEDAAALARMARECAAISTEFENIPAFVLEQLEAKVPVRPASRCVHIVQDRLREKTFLAGQGFPVAEFAPVYNPSDLIAAAAKTGFPAVLKRAAFGYDGKGQVRVTEAAALASAFAELGGVPCVLEQQVDLAMELSVVLARNARGETATYPVTENLHRNGILHRSIVPAQIDAELAAGAESMSREVAEALDYEGVLAVEFFLERDGRLLINEIAPRPHNSGHYTVDACAASQFEQQLRVMCDLPLGSTRLLTPAVMVNLLGNLWAEGEPDWEAVFATSEARLHLYGKREPRPGRKMGHYTVLGETVQAAETAARAVFDALTRTP